VSARGEGRRDTVQRIGVYALLIIGALLAILPMLWMVSASLMPTGDANSFPPRLLPRVVTLDHYRDLFTRLALGRALANSALIAVLVTVISVIVNSMAGYALAKLRFKSSRKVYRGLSVGLVLPAQVAMLPLFLLMKQLHLVNTYWGVIIPGLASIFGILLTHQYALAIPDDLLDAARVDGASELQLYRLIVLPVIAPILATLAIWTFLSTWNDFMWPLIVLSDDRRYTLPVAIANLVGEHVQDTELMMAGSVVTVLPVMLVFLFLQRYYIRGITAGSVK
jgi:multiple sugar transport system permease protein